MKHIKCMKCRSLIRPANWIAHYRSCDPGKEVDMESSREQTTKAREISEEEKDPSLEQPVQETTTGESEAKRQKTEESITDGGEHHPGRNQENGRNERYPNTERPDSMCAKCGKLYATKSNRQRHESRCVGPKLKKTDVTVCTHCRKGFSDYRTRLRHERMCSNKSNFQTKFSCTHCGDKFPSAIKLIEHENKLNHNRSGGSSTTNNSNLKTNTSKSSTTNTNNDIPYNNNNQPHCRICGDRFVNYKTLYNHRMLVHKQSGNGKLQSDPWTDNTDEIVPWVNDDGSENESMRRVYDQHRHLILRERFREGDVTSSYNFPISNNLNLEQIMEHVEFIYQQSQNAFKINISFGLILQNISDSSYRYFVPYRNEMLFMFPQVISNRSDVEKLRNMLSNLDLSNYFQKAKPNSKWKPVAVVNCFYQVFKMGFPIGLSQPLPKHITHSKSICSFEKHPRTGKPFADYLCFFRCLAYHQTKNKYCEKLTGQLHSKWIQYVNQTRFRSTDVNLQRLPDLEICFETNINVFELSEDETVTVLYKTRECFRSENSKTMNINLFEDHFSYITKFNSYASKFRCKLCDKLFNSQCDTNRHEKTCENATKLRFPGGYFASPKNMFDKLTDLGINVETALMNYPWFITFDMEAILKQVEEQNGDHLTKTSRHDPISVSICSNVDGYTDPKFILDENLDSLLTNMISYLNEISNAVNILSHQRWSDVFDQLNSLEGKWINEGENVENELMSVQSCDGNDYAAENSGDDDDDECVVDDDDDGCEARESNECEPPTKEFLHAMSKENVFYRFLKDLESTDNVSVQYNEWNNDDNNKDDDDDDGDDDDDYSICSSCSGSNTDNSDNNTSSGVYQVIQPIRYRIESDDDDDDDDDDSVNLGVYPQTKYLMSKLIRRTREQFETYCHQVPVLGFNSAKYDLNLLKSKLAKHLKLHEPKQQKFVVKRNNAYMCLSNPRLRFLDMVNYLPPGTSYDKFLCTFGVNQRKSYFPYEYFTDVSVLDTRSLPPKEAFYSSLKQSNVLEDPERVVYERLTVKENKTECEALSILKLQTPPTSTIDEKYETLQLVWRENKMTTFRDYLEYYNSLDVLPMVEGVEKFKNYFVERGVDVFKDCISVPGAARKMLYQSGFKTGASFALIDKHDLDLYHTIKSNIVGGPSIIFTRYQEAGQTFIRENENIPCQSVLGYDANSLYVYALGKPMPCGNYIRRRSENNFKPEQNTNRYVAMYDWMEWLNHSHDANIKHKMNYGYEKRVGPYLADGFDDKNVIYEFFGCYFHGHSCITPTNTDQHHQRFTRTQERLTYLRSQGYKIVSIWECEFRNQVKENHEMREFISQRYPSFYKTHNGQVKDSQILDSVVKEELFGFIEVDIQVPDSWNQVKYKPTTDLNPSQYFTEMCPLFCTTDVNFDCIGEHMQSHAEKYGLSTKPRTLLVGGTKAECLLLSSPLLKWYIEHGLLVTKIYQVVEFSKLSCFKEFVDKVTDDRRQGDVDKSQELKSALSKLVGVSAFGGTIINQEKFQKIKYVEGFKKACFAVNNPRFRQLNELGDDMFESEFANVNISINSPVYLGYMILQYAKLHMLSFYFDFLLKFVGMEKFEMAEMDTDSCYFGLASSTLRDAIKPGMQDVFDRTILGNCTDDFAGDNFNNVWFPRECCPKHNKHDMRTPGLMKLEFSGTQIIGLCSKSYIAINKEDENTKNVKYSLKGVNNQFVDPTDLFKRVLNTQDPVTADNRGIRSFNNSMFTYIQPKQAFNYFYCKRLVLSDGIHTKPLDITLKPINKYKNEVEIKLKDLEDLLNSIV